MIRDAERKDIPHVAELFYMSGPDMAHYSFVSGKDVSLQLIGMLADQPENIFSHEHYRVFTENGEIVAGAASYEGNLEPAYSSNIDSHGIAIIKIAGPIRPFRMLFRQMALHRHHPEIPKDTLYLQSLAIEPEFRGQGIYEALLNDTKEKCRSRGLDKISLLVETNNSHAFNIYNKSGFELIETKSFPQRYHRFNLYGYHLMVLPV